MALRHIPAGEIVSARPLGDALGDTRTHTLVREPDLQVMRLVLRAGQTLHEHHVPERLVFQCIEGNIEFETHGKRLMLAPGDLVHIARGEPHAVHAAQPASALLFLFGHDTIHAGTEATP